MIQNYQKWLDNELIRIADSTKIPRLLLHVCCAPCSSYVLEYLNTYFNITLHFYNPNISPASEYEYRAAELTRLVSEMPLKNPVTVHIPSYDPAPFTAICKGYEHLPEGGERCTKCYRLRLEDAARAAAEGHYDYFTTTLSISPLKDARRLNDIGGTLAEKYGVPYLYSDFKKREGYKRSIQLSAEHQLYRQDYCGCSFSKRDAEIRKAERKD